MNFCIRYRVLLSLICFVLANMFSSILNGIPVVGHIKGIVHDISGNSYAASQAYKAANRSTAVVAGGVVGCAAGPAGAIAGATAAGLLMDTGESIRTGQPTGIIKGVDMIVDDVKKGEVPIGSTCVTTLLVCSDALSGLGGGGLAQGTSVIIQQGAKGAAKTVAIEVSKAVVKEEVATIAGAALTKVVADKCGEMVNEIQENQSSNKSKPSNTPPPSTTPPPSNSSPPPNNPSRGPSQTQHPSSNTSSSGAGSQPPQGNQNNNQGGCNQQQVQTHLSVFLQIFGVSSLDDILIGNRRIFKNLTRTQLNDLKKLIKYLNEKGILQVVIQTVEELFRNLDENDASFKNFMNLAEFVAVYMEEYFEWKSAELTSTGHQGTLDDILLSIMNTFAQIPVLISHCLQLFLRLASAIRFQCRSGMVHDFRTIFAALCHYYKHRKLPNGRILAVSEYFDLVKRMLELAQQQPEYAELVDPHNSRDVLRLTIHDAEYGNVLIVLKIQNGTIVVASVYVIAITPIT